MKRCSACGRTLPFDEFHRNRRKSGGREARCRACKCAAVNEHRQNHREAINSRRRERYQERRPGWWRAGKLRRYGITEEDYDRLLELQDGRCAICRQAETTNANNGERLKLLAVDHDHQTGQVRGLLCAQCNKGIGNLREDPVILQNALDYLAGIEIVA